MYHPRTVVVKLFLLLRVTSGGMGTPLVHMQFTVAQEELFLAVALVLKSNMSRKEEGS